MVHGLVGLTIFFFRFGSTRSDLCDVNANFTLHPPAPSLALFCASLFWWWYLPFSGVEGLLVDVLGSLTLGIIISYGLLLFCLASGLGEYGPRPEAVLGELMGPAGLKVNGHIGQARSP